MTNFDQNEIYGIIEDTEEYRDHIATVDQSGKRIWIYPKKPKGRFYNARTWMSFVFLAFFLSMPFIKVNGEQFLLLNVLERKFVLFGLLFTPQDFHLFGLAMLTFVVFIILFTVVYGRLFCGWVCPQTVFMEMFFRKIEYWIEGDANEQRKLNNSPWTNEKIRKKGLKHAIFFLIAVVAANFFLAYIIGMDQVLQIISDPVEAHLGGFISMILFSGAFYFVFSRLREQVCTTICPYGRLQGVLLVKETIVVIYDFLRGEPRSKVKRTREKPAADPAVMADVRAALKPAGDCVDCKLCIAVCPTGIDIRNGTQLECTNCTACMDACDEVMDKVGRKRGLIRYDSTVGVGTGKRKLFTPRVLAYTGVLLALVALDVLLFATRGSVETIILRTPGQLYQQHDETHISNLYNYQIVNKTVKDIPVELRMVTTGGRIEMVGHQMDSIHKADKISGSFFIIMPSDQVHGRKTPIKLEVYSNGKKIDEVQTSFMGPGR